LRYQGQHARGEVDPVKGMWSEELAGKSCIEDGTHFSYAFPIWNLVDMSKSTIFATKNHLAQNFAVNLG